MAKSESGKLIADALRYARTDTDLLPNKMRQAKILTKPPGSDPGRFFKYDPGFLRKDRTESDVGCRIRHVYWVPFFLSVIFAGNFGDKSIHDHTKTEAICYFKIKRTKNEEGGREGEGERENSNSKTLFSKDCSLGSFRPNNFSLC